MCSKVTIWNKQCVCFILEFEIAVIVKAEFDFTWLLKLKFGIEFKFVR